MKPKLSLLLLFFITVLSVSCTKDRNGKQSSKNKKELTGTAKKVDSVLSLMTLEEKIGQMVQYNGSWEVTGPPTGSRDKERLANLKKGLVGSMLNVTSVKHVQEAQRLIMENSRLKIPLLFGYDVIHGYKTMFPIPLGESASWDLGLMEKTAAVAAKETSAAGINWTFAPMIDISRDARWGRIMEGAGEDPFLGSKIAVARIKGFQGNDLSGPNTIAACAKHLAGYGFAEAGRDYNTVNIGLHTLHNQILPPFKAAAKANVATMMNAFNEIDGIPSTANKYLQREVVKNTWGWEGFIVSDWASIRELIVHGVAEDGKKAAELAANAGSDMDMDDGIYEKHLLQLVKENKVKQEYIDNSVRRILSLKFKLGLFDNPYLYCDTSREQQEIFTEDNRKTALEAAQKSIVLLKNEDNILPLTDKVKNIAVIGPLAADKDSPLGNWRAQAVSNSAVSVLEGIKNRAPKEVKITYAEGAPLITNKDRVFQTKLTYNTTNKTGFDKAIKVAKQADVVLLVVGEDAYQSGEGRSQTDIGFKGVQDELIQKIQEVNPNVIMVLMNGRPMDLSKHHTSMKGILETWFLGSEHGNAVADVIFGDYNPSGKLPISFPRNVGQEPLYYNQKNTGRPTGNNIVTYSHFTDEGKDALFPFGYGLSYTQFSYSEITLNNASFKEDGFIEASVKISNVGDKEGEEVVQLYIKDLVGSITRPIKELKGFKKIHLKPGETKSVSFKIDEELISFFTINKKWEAEPGKFQLFIGGNSIDLKEASFEYSK